jgi:hypothetical protein
MKEPTNDMATAGLAAHVAFIETQRTGDPVLDSFNGMHAAITAALAAAPTVDEIAETSVGPDSVAGLRAQPTAQVRCCSHGTTRATCSGT